MRTRNIFRYLLAIIIALGTTVNVFAQEKTMKIYFEQNPGAGNNSIPKVTCRGDIPLTDMIVTPEGAIWANNYRIIEGFTGTPTDRILAGYVDENTKMDSHMKISFTNFPFEVNEIQWNAMNDLLSGRINDLTRLSWQDLFDIKRLLEFIKSMDLFGNYTVNYKYTPVKNGAVEGEAIESKSQHWNMNIFTHQMTFNQGTMPGASNMTLSGLESFEFAEENYWKTVLGFISQKVALKEECRTFIKAGWNGQSGSNSNIGDSDDSNWAFKVKFTLPDIRMSCYNTATNAVDNNIIVKEKGGTHKLKGDITAHRGAVIPTENPVNPDDFHFKYEADANKIVIRPTSGVIEQVKVAGDIPVTVKLMRGEREVCSYTQTIHVYSVDPTRPQIAIGFLNANKGYDITVGDENAQIKGYIMANGDNITLTDATGYHFEFSEDSNGEIIDLDPLTGKITAKKEGDVVVSAVLKNGTTIKSNTSSYTLHVFAKDEGLDWHRVTTYYIIQTSNANWHIDNGTGHTDDYNAERTGRDFYAYDWKKVQDLRTNMNLQNTDDWKQITGFRTTANTSYWRAICQKIGLDVKVPKYSDVHFSYTFDGKVANQGGKNYGFEVKNLGVATSSEADTKIKTIAWKANGEVASSGAFRDNPILPTMIVAGAGSNSANHVDAKTDISLEKSNANGAAPITDTHYLAIMSYLGINNNNKGDAAFGYKGIPTYTYHATITYYNNDGTGNVWETQTFTSTSKTETKPMYRGKHNLTRNGYELLGFSTNPEATTPEYKITIDKQYGLYIVEGDFCPYDAVNGGGKGPISLYAVWNKIPDIVTLDPQGGTGGNTQTTAIYGQKLPNGLEAPTKPGYEFRGYYSNANDEWPESQGQDIYYGGKEYYDKDMNGVEPWDKTQGGTIYAHWAPKTYIVTFDGSKSAVVPKQMQYDNGNLPFSDVIYNSEGVVKISFTYGSQCPSQITNGKFKKAGFKLVGFYDSNNVLVATVDVDHPEDRNIYFNESSGYWTKKNGNLVWNCAHDVNLTARYEPKYTVRDGDIIDFGTEYLEVGIDWENSMVHDLLGAAEAEKEAGRISSTNPVMVFDIRNARYLDNSSKKSDDLMVPLRDKDFISPNLLVYLGEGAYDVIENEIKTDGTCPGLVVTDRFPIKIPYAFNASKASYARDAKVADGDKGKDQAKNSYWGTLCLPYPIRNNASGVKFYEFQSTANNYFMFEEMSDNEVIPANTPVLYCRTDGGVGSMITIEEEEKDVNCNGIITKDEMVSVPANPNFTALVKSYANAHESIQDWEFRGNLKTNVFCGRGYNNAPAEAIANSDITDNGEVYYFKQNKFTRLVPATTKNVNGKETHYDAGKMTLYPYRAYFYKKDVNGSSAKVSAYSILVVDEFGNTTDITNAVFGDGEGDGKIYDLNGIRVMQPVKGRLYIVNGQKKVYR